MTATVTEGELAGLRWLGVEGPREEVFRALGEAARDDVAGLLDRPEFVAVRRHAETGAGRVARDIVLDATRWSHPTELGEVAALAAGAGVDEDLLVLANLRGDLGAIARDARPGCSDLGWRRARSYLAHNEDGDAWLADRLVLLSLAVEGEPAVTALWYPGFLPSNAFVLTGAGLAWGIDHLQVDEPEIAPGRHFAARAMQRSADLDEAVAHAADHPGAGGFAYTIGSVDGRVATVEAAAGVSATVFADPDADPLLWHTNHLRYADADAELPVTSGEDTERRGAVLAGLGVPATEPDAEWFLEALTGRAYPDGVCKPVGAGAGATLCTTVADLTARELTLRSARGERATLGFEKVLAGP